jgi:hypothetical protein
MNTASCGRSAGLRQLAAARADIARRVAAVDRNLDRALRERSHAVVLVLPRRRAAARARAHLRAIDRGHSPASTTSKAFRHATCLWNSWHPPSSTSTSWAALSAAFLPTKRRTTAPKPAAGSALLGRELGLDAGLHVRFTDSYDDLRSQVHELGATMDRLLARLHELLTGAARRDRRHVLCLIDACSARCLPAEQRVSARR